MLTLLHTTELLATAEASYRDASRAGNPVALFHAHNTRALAINADDWAWQEALAAEAPEAQAAHHADTSGTGFRLFLDTFLRDVRRESDQRLATQHQPGAVVAGVIHF